MSKRESYFDDFKNALLWYLEEELDSGEILFKEIWENCDSDYDAKKDLTKLIAHIRKLQP